MGLGTQITVILICIAFLFSFAPRPCGEADLLVANTTCSNSSGAVTGLTVGYGSASPFEFLKTNLSYEGLLRANFASLLAGIGLVGVAISMFFPNPYLLFFSFALFLLGFATIPYDIVTKSQSFGLSLSDPFIQFFLLILSFLMIVAAVTWFKGNEW